MFEVPFGTPLTYEHFLAMVHPDDQEAVDRSWKAALRGEGYDVTHRALINGNTLWLHQKAELEFTEDGTLIAGFGTVQDITEHKNDE
jgi:PAS domain S-box-containing protein